MTDRRQTCSGQRYSPNQPPSNSFTSRKVGNRQDSVFENAIPTVDQDSYWRTIDQSVSTRFAPLLSIS
jgi:hypothetical protein